MRAVTIQSLVQQLLADIHDAVETGAEMHKYYC
jgi:hypothetical protein